MRHSARALTEQMSLKRLNLTDIVLDIGRAPKKTALKKAISEGQVESKFAATPWGKKLAARVRHLPWDHRATAHTHKLAYTGLISGVGRGGLP